MCKISAKNSKFYGSWSSSKFSIFQIKKPGFLEILDLCLNLGIGFCINWLVLSNYKEIIARKKQFQINHASHLKNFTKFTGKYLCQSLFFDKVAGLRPATLLKKRLWHRCFPVNFVKFLRTSFLQNTSGRLLLVASEILT